MRIYSPPKIIKNYFKDFIWNSSKNKILLTFDDSPNPGTTELILSFLNAHSLKAVFFCVGSQIIKNKELAKEIISEDHTLGNHTFSHKNLFHSRNKIVKEIDCTCAAAESLLDYKFKYFRPPYGKFDFRLKYIAQEKNLKVLMWSLLTYDYQNDLNIVKFALSKYLKNNSVIVFHDNQKSKMIIIDSLKYLLDEINIKEYAIGEPEECLK